MRSQSKAPAISVMLIGLIGCATSPGQIKPIAVSDVHFSKFSCEELASVAADTAVALATTWENQKNAAEGDALGVFLIGVPASSMGGGDVGYALARHLGEAEAIDRVSDEMDCGFDFVYPDAIVKHRAKPATKRRGPASR
jgi:hypothetical protein